MRYSTSSVMMLAAIGISEAVAGPAHAHLHRHAHEKKDAKPDVDWNSLNWDNMGINWSSAYEAGQATKTTVTSTSTAVPATAAAVVAETTEASTVATTATSSAAATTASSSSILDDIAELFDGLVGASNSRTSFGTIVKGDGTTGDSSYGNYGGPYGSNIIKVDSTASYDYTVEFVNTQSSSITVNIWNKVGPDLQPLSGSALAPKNTSLTFVLKAGASQIVAFDEDSQVAWAQACSATTASGSYSQTWGEANFVSTGSGYDMSAIENSEGNVYNMTLTSVEAPACTSDPTQNYWLTATDPVGDSDGSCYIAQSTAHLTALMAGAI